MATLLPASGSPSPAGLPENGQRPASSRSLWSTVQAVANWVFGGLTSIWNYLTSWRGKQPPINSNREVIPYNGQHSGVLARMRRAVASVFPVSVDHDLADQWLSRVTREIQQILSQHENYPNRTTVCVRIEGRGAEPFTGFFNLDLQTRPNSFAWSETLYQRVRDYLNTHEILKFDLGFVISQRVGAEASGQPIFNMELTSGSLDLHLRGTAIFWTTSSSRNVCAEFCKLCLQSQPVFASALENDPVFQEQ